jgi:glycosyltransferase involved in cell wall biosynthesis
MKDAPHNLHDRLLDPVHNAVDVEQYKFEDNKKDYFLTLARFSHEKGQHIAVDLCVELGYKLQMAGTCASIGNVEDLMLELLNPESKFRRNADFRYYSDHASLNGSPQNNQEHSERGQEKKSSSAAKLLFPVLG